MRRLIESMDKISEAGPKGLQRPGLELGPEMGGGGGGGIGGAPSATSMARLPTLTNVVKPPPPAVWRTRSGQTTATPPGGTAVAQPLPPGVTPSTAGAGRGTAPVTQPAPLGKDAGAAGAGARDSAVRKDTGSVGGYRPGGERDPLGRIEPGNRDGRTWPTVGDYSKPGDTKKAAAISAAIHGGLAGLALWPSKDKKSGTVQTSSDKKVDNVPAGDQTYKVDLYRPEPGDPGYEPPAETSIDLPKVGPQGAESPFYVLPGSSAETILEPAPKPPTPKPATPTAVAAPKPAVPASSSGAGTATKPGVGGGEGDSVETILQRQGYIKETAIEKLLNNFTKFIESTTKNKSKAK